jgi:signal transduction histidine kinase
MAFVVIAIEKASLHSDVLADKRRMDAIFANMTEGLLTVTLGGRITAANLALQTMVGVEDGSLVGRCCCDAIRTDPDILGSLLAQMRTAEKQQDSFHGSCDIDFVANITHEVRTPLATILLYARLLRAGRAKDDPEREARYLDIVAQQSNQIQKLVRKILDLSRMEAMLAYPGRESIQLHALLNEMLVSYQKLAQQKQLVIRADLPADLPAVTASREALQLVFGNLLDNAIKFASRGEIRLSARQSGKQVQVDVSDEGIGIAPESIPHLFERFYRTEEAVERGIGGTGLGLALVKETIEGLGGSVTVTSRPDEGTTFRVVLPIATDSSFEWPDLPCSCAASPTILDARREAALSPVRTRVVSAECCEPSSPAFTRLHPKEAGFPLGGCCTLATGSSAESCARHSSGGDGA